MIQQPFPLSPSELINLGVSSGLPLRAQKMLVRTHALVDLHASAMQFFGLRFKAKDNVDYSIELVEGILILQLISKRADRLVKNYRSLWAERVERRLHPNSFGLFF